MKAWTTVALLLAALSFGSGAAYAQAEHPPAGHRAHVHRGRQTHNPAPAPIVEHPAQSNAPQTNPMLKPYPHPGEGDNDGLSRDPDDCMKGCIGGNPG